MEVQQMGNARVVRLMERVDSITSQEVETSLQALIAANAPQIICDCTGTRYISSSGLRAVLLAAKNLKRAGGLFSLVCAPSDYVYEVFELTGITHIVPVFATVDEAMAKLA